MYISRLPTLLNQVQAMVSLPSGSSEGTLKLMGLAWASPLSAKLPLEVVMQPPSTEWMTFHLEDAVGFSSLVTEIWQDPPP